MYVLRAIMFSVIIGMFGGLFASLAVDAIVSALGFTFFVSYPVMAIVIAVAWFCVEMGMGKPTDDDSSSS